MIIVHARGVAFKSAEKLGARVVRNRYWPMSMAERGFAAACDEVWHEVFQRVERQVNAKRPPTPSSGD
ncbi:hypothetical protein [Piscinibacter koreensis]|uniref:Uncharacterized protein n=1 Tax=Piscinibacter koreensis TaxID=2742824 RepID=A0A7Y6TY26_9BURK|nr:hypothetical protein [Schlegelella koreensis]NUZ07682.1 hypothetical protein [Schlegelella koreensis]